MFAQIPNAITLLNLFFGACALLLTFAGRPDWAMWCLMGSFACDTADGLVARALKVDGPLGKQLDSLADVVSFGLVPGAMLYYLLQNSFCGSGAESIFYPPASALKYYALGPVCWPALPAFVLSMFAAYRLGKFNIDTRQTSYFLGLSTPATTIFVMGIALGAFHNRFGLGDFLADNPWVVYALIPLLSWLMASEIPLAGLKIKHFGWKGNEALILILLAFVALTFFLKELSFSLIILIYIVYSLLNKNKL